jgi:predicted DNA-binding protein (UPF0251 family)
MHRRGENSRRALLQRVEGELDLVYDLIHQVFADEAFSLRVLQSFLKRATRRSRKERYEKYLRLWVMRIAVECIQRAYPRYLAECASEKQVPLHFLPLEEKLAIFLTDRSRLDPEEAASVLQISTGRMGRSLAYAREKVAMQRLSLGWEKEGVLALRERISLNLSPNKGGAYSIAMLAVCAHIADLPTKKFSEIESTVRQNQLLPLLGRPDVVRWQDLSWQYKLGLEASLIGVVGLLAVVVLPWVFSQVDANALVEGRFAEVLKVESKATEPAPLEEITAERLLASSEAETVSSPAEPDEFANIDFPSGDAYEAGTAPLAPSRQSAAVFRLIIQSPSPREMVSQVRALFAERNVKERQGSGRVMPGGIFFDGVTSVGEYGRLLQEVRQSGHRARTYSNPAASKNPKERARVIIWVQQI